MTLELDSVLKGVGACLARQRAAAVFSPNLAQATAVAAQIEAGALELVRAGLGRRRPRGRGNMPAAQNVSRDAARRAIAENIGASSDKGGGKPIPMPWLSWRRWPALSRTRGAP